HTLSVTSLTVSPNSKWLASGSDDSTIILFELVDQSAFRKWDARVGNSLTLALSPDSQRIVCSGSNGRIIVWDVEQGDELSVLKEHTKRWCPVVWSPDGTKLASCSPDQTVRIWDATSYQQIHSLEGHSSTVTCVTFSPDGKLLASGGLLDHEIRICEVETGALKHGPPEHPHALLAVQFDPHANRIASSLLDNFVRICCFDTGEELVLRGRGKAARRFTFSEDGKQIMVPWTITGLRIYDSLSGECILTPSHNGSLFWAHIAKFSPDGKYIAGASTSFDNTVSLWNRSDGTCAVTFYEHSDEVMFVAFSPDGRTLSSASSDGMVCIRRLSNFV
ncbi:WD40-repeat-containing domain protein, partial [Cerioporus squamosus]